jgi:hypothetical protein
MKWGLAIIFVLIDFAAFPFATIPTVAFIFYGPAALFMVLLPGLGLWGPMVLNWLCYALLGFCLGIPLDRWAARAPETKKPG